MFFFFLFRLAICNLTDQSCKGLASALQSSNSSLRELDLTNNDLQNSGVKFLCAGLKSTNCTLKILRYFITLLNITFFFYNSSSLCQSIEQWKESWWILHTGRWQSNFTYVLNFWTVTVWSRNIFCNFEFSEKLTFLSLTADQLFMVFSSDHH